MRLSVYLSVFCLAYAGFGRASPTPQSYSHSNSSIDSFLETIKVNPSHIPQNIKGAGGAILTCTILDLARSSEIVEARNGSLYTMEREAHWSPTAWDSPTCIFNAQSSDDVIFAVKVLGFTGTKYAVRSGGHSPHLDFANIGTGVLISMSAITDFSYDARSETARFGFGHRWGELYGLLEPYQRLVVGGRIPPVGMALTTGGGLSHLSNAHGWSADNVVNFEVVLASGKAVNANATSHADLFWALKGGQNNFGIVTHMTHKTYPYGTVWGGSLVFNNTYRDQLMSAFATYGQVGQLDTNSALITDMAITNNTLYLTLVYFAPVEKPDCFKPFYDIPALLDNTAIHDNFTDIIDATVDQVVPRWTYGYTNMYVDNATYVDIGRLCQDQAKGLATVNGGTMVLIPQPVSKTMIDHANQSGGNPLGLRSRAQLWFNLSIGWNLASDDQKVYNLLLDTIAKIEVLTKSRNLYDPFVFLNDAFKTQSVYPSWGAENLVKLQAVSQAYDPAGMFQHQVPGGFKVF